MTEFPGRNWSLASVKRLLQQTDIRPDLQTASQAVADVTVHALAQTLNLISDQHKVVFCTNVRALFEMHVAILT